MRFILALVVFTHLYLSVADFLFGYGNAKVIYGRKKVTTCQNSQELSNWHWGYKLGCFIGKDVE